MSNSAHEVLPHPHENKIMCVLKNSCNIFVFSHVKYYLSHIFLPTISFKNVKAIHYVFFFKIPFSSKNSSEVILTSIPCIQIE